MAGWTRPADITTMREHGLLLSTNRPNVGQMTYGVFKKGSAFSHAPKGAAARRCFLEALGRACWSGSGTSLRSFGDSPMNAFKSRPSSIHIFLADGQPDGLRTVEKPGWTGLAVVCPRSRFPEVKAIDEFAREFNSTGVYVLRGPSEDGDLPTIYVGEGDPTCPRLEEHYLKKDFWTSVIVFTGKNLNKAHVQYLESRLVSLARDAKRCVLNNSKNPQLPTLSIPDTAAMEAFLGEMLVIYPVLGLTAFEVPRTRDPSDTIFHLKRKGIVARGYDKDEGFVVLAGSEAVGNKGITSSASESLVNLRKSLVKQGVLVAEGDHFKFTQDYTFNSPSQAASVPIGHSVSGPDSWKDDQGRTLKAIQQAAIGGSAWQKAGLASEGG